MKMNLNERGMKGEMKITYQLLKEKGACSEVLQWFKDRFKEEDEVDYQAVLDELAKENNAKWAKWLFSKFGYTKTMLQIEGDLVLEHSLFFAGLIKVSGNIICKYLSGSGIKAGWGIKASEGIKAGKGIEVGKGKKTASPAATSEAISE